MTKFIEVENGLKVAYKKQGDSKNTIVFIHQNSGSSLVWETQLNDKLFSEYSLICIDLSGHGESTRSKNPSVDYSLKEVATCVLRVLEKLELENYIIVSLSLGCNIIAEIIPKLKGSVGFIMAGPSLVGGSITPNDVLLPLKYSQVLFQEKPSDEDLIELVSALVSKDDETVLNELMNDFLKTDGRFRATFASSIGRQEWTNEIENVVNTNLPFILLYGAEDKLVDTSYLAHDFLNTLKNRTTVIEGAGHLVNLDQPEAFNLTLAKFAQETF